MTSVARVVVRYTATLGEQMCSRQPTSPRRRTGNRRYGRLVHALPDRGKLVSQGLYCDVLPGVTGENRPDVHHFGRNQYGQRVYAAICNSCAESLKVFPHAVVAADLHDTVAWQC